MLQKIARQLLLERFLQKKALGLSGTKIIGGKRKFLDFLLRKDPGFSGIYSALYQTGKKPFGALSQILNSRTQTAAMLKTQFLKDISTGKNLPPLRSEYVKQMKQLRNPSNIIEDFYRQSGL